MKKAIISTLGACAIVIFAAVFWHNELLDRVNPLVAHETSYAKVEQGTQTYKDVAVYDKDGRKENYTLDFGGYDASKSYVEIKRKGKYVSEISYVNPSDVPHVVK